jgi:hypothetical protein
MISMWLCPYHAGQVNKDTGPNMARPLAVTNEQFPAESHYSERFAFKVPVEILKGTN